MVEHKPSKLDTGVRFPSPAVLPEISIICANGSVVEHRLAKARVASSNLVSRLLTKREKSSNHHGYWTFYILSSMAFWGVMPSICLLFAFYAVQVVY